MMIFYIKLKSEFYRISPYKDCFYTFYFDNFPELLFVVTLVLVMHIPGHLK